MPGEVSTDPARPPHTAAHGVWRYLGKGRFGVTIWDIFYDVNTGQLLHYMKIRLEVTLGDDRDEASARATLEVIDPQGVVLSSRNGALSLARIPLSGSRGRDLDGQCCHECVEPARHRTGLVYQVAPLLPGPPY